MDVAAKQAHHRDRMREPAVVCPICDTHTTPRDLVQHLARRCSGRRAPHHGSAWVVWREARLLVPQATLSRWVGAGLVRVKGQQQDRLYLLRDLVMCLAWRRLTLPGRRR
jgi:hypothetical protein